MELVKWKERVNEFIKKFKYAWIVLLVGILLMLIPGKDIKEQNIDKEICESVYAADDLETRLEDLLSKVDGAGDVNVMLSIGQGERTIYQTDSSYSQNDAHSESRTETIIISDSGRNESGLVHQRNPPNYKGAIVLCHGADEPAVRLAIVDAVRKITGLGADKIAVLKMR